MAAGRGPLDRRDGLGWGPRITEMQKRSTCFRRLLPTYVRIVDRVHEPASKVPPHSRIARAEPSRGSVRYSVYLQLAFLVVGGKDAAFECDGEGVDTPALRRSADIRRANCGLTDGRPSAHHGARLEREPMTDIRIHDNGVFRCGKSGASRIGCCVWVRRGLDGRSAFGRCRIERGLVGIRVGCPWLRRHSATSIGSALLGGSC